MSQELIERMRSEAETFEPGSFAQTMLLEAADTIQYLLDGADEVNQALREQIEENERLKAENVWLKSMNERLSRPTLSQLRREKNQLESDNERLKAEKNQLQETLDMYGGDCGITAFIEQLEKLKAENAHLTADIDILMHAVEGDCTYCRHNGEWRDQSPCWHCKGFAAKERVTGDYWQWRGVKRRI